MKGTIKGKVYLGLMMLFAMALWLAGCSASKDSGDKVRDLDFTVAGDMDVPDELKNLIAEKQQQPFKLTYSDEQNLYIAVGYGVQPTGGYSISVNELYLTDNCIEGGWSIDDYNADSSAGHAQDQWAFDKPMDPSDIVLLNFDGVDVPLQ